MTHLVHFWLKEEFQTEECRAEFEAALTSLCKIPLATSSSWGRPAKVEERPVVDLSWDYNLVTTFKTVEDHNAYQIHEEHLAFLNDHKHKWAKVLVMDSEISFTYPS